MEFDYKLYYYEHVFRDTKLSLDIGDIVRIAEISLKKGAEVPVSVQECNLIVFCVSGKALIKVNDSSESISENQVYFIKKGVKHGIVVSDEKNCRYICLGFEPNLSHPTVITFEKIMTDLDSFVIDDNGYIRHLSELLIWELHLNDIYKSEMISTLISWILTALIRILKSGDDYTVSLLRKSRKNLNNAMYEVLRYIEKEYFKITNIKELADTLNYSESYLSHLFSAKMGISLKEYIVKKKIDRAIELLRQGDMTVENISEHLNFSSIRVFRRAFKLNTGHTPSYFRDN